MNAVVGGKDPPLNCDPRRIRCSNPKFYKNRIDFNTYFLFDFIHTLLLPQQSLDVN